MDPDPVFQVRLLAGGSLAAATAARRSLRNFGWCPGSACWASSQAACAPSSPTMVRPGQPTRSVSSASHVVLASSMLRHSASSWGREPRASCGLLRDPAYPLVLFAPGQEFRAQFFVHAATVRRPGALALASGNADVVVFPGELAFLLGQVRFPDRNHEAPVLADRAALHPGHYQVQFLELDAGNPDGREQVALAAPHDGVSPQVVAEARPIRVAPVTTPTTIRVVRTTRRDIPSLWHHVGIMAGLGAHGLDVARQGQVAGRLTRKTRPSRARPPGRLLKPLAVACWPRWLGLRGGRCSASSAIFRARCGAGLVGDIGRVDQGPAG